MKVSIPQRIKIVFEIEGKEFPCHRPTVGEVIEHEEAVKAAESAGATPTALVLSFLARCGLPEEVTRALDPDQLVVVLEALKPSKKN